MEKQDETSSLNPPLPLPPELIYEITSLLYRHEGAKLGEVCRFFYNSSRNGQPFWKLPFAPLDYSKETALSFFNRDHLNGNAVDPDVSDMIVLSNNLVAVVFSDGRIKFHIFNGTTKLYCHEEQIKFESIPDLNINPVVITELSGKLVFGAEASDVFKLFEITESLKLQFIKDISTTFPPRSDFEQGYKLITIDENRFVAVGPKLLKVFDLSKPAGKECVKTMQAQTSVDILLDSDFRNITVLSKNKLICCPASNKNILTIFDLSENDSEKSVRTITLNDRILNFSILSSGRIAVCNYPVGNDVSRTKLSIIDLDKPEGTNEINHLVIEHKNWLNDMKSLPGDHIVLNFQNPYNHGPDNVYIDIYDCNPTHIHRISSLKSARGPLASLKDGRIIKLVSSGLREDGTLCVHNFERKQEAQLTLEQNFTNKM